jgi:cysteine rich repeat protein
MGQTIKAAAVCALIAGVPCAMSAEPNALMINKACGPDLQRLCPDVKPGGGRIAECIRENVDKLSPACREAVKTAQANKKG